MIEIAPLGRADPAAVEHLLDAAFGADRRTRTAYRLRIGARAIASLSFSAFAAGDLIGSLQSWPILLAGDDGVTAPLVMVGPVAVAPARQGDGVGTRLMTALSTAAQAQGRAMMMIGDPGYYGRFGFSADATAGWRIDGPVERHRLLACSPHPLPRDGALRPAA